jgi:hypothetical protein
MTHHPDDLAAGTVPLSAPDATSGRSTNPRDPAGVQDPEAGNVAVATWEGEGGHFPEVALTPVEVSRLAPEPRSAGGGLLAMQARFVSDFADGLMGRHHNTFQHRSRVLRRLAEAVPDPGRSRH